MLRRRGAEASWTGSPARRTLQPMPSQPTDGGAAAQMDLASIEAVAELTIRLGRVMRPDYVMSWLLTGGIEALGGERPIDLIARGDIESVARVASSLEDPGAV
jgi:hypothetical protein